ncbi:MAG: hypothetical protein RLY71_963 [Pseudomonadota bacterium]|jgi:hypothetical protein
MKKNILLIGLNYHAYTAEIVRALQSQGHEVHFHDIQPGRFWLKVLRKFAPARYPDALDKYHRSIVAAERDWQADLVLFIQVHQMAQATLAALRQSHPKAEFVLYNWDAVSNHDYQPYLHHFQRVYTFDPQDARVLGLHYLPLFCIPAFLGLQRRDTTAQSVYTVGNIVNPKRYEAIHAFKRHCAHQGIGFRTFMVGSTHALTLLLRGGHLPFDVSLRSIPQADFIRLIETSSAVFDFANHRQVGYTMRTIENLCAGKKIITNNPVIRDEPFYSDDRIHVFDGLDFSGVKAFLARPLRDPAADFPEFHLDNFVRRLVDDPAACCPQDCTAQPHPAHATANAARRVAAP